VSAPVGPPSGAPVGIGLVRPDLLGTYGDGGNALVLAERLVRRGIAAEVIPLMADSEVPRSVAVLVLGGGEDAAQRALLRDATLMRGVCQAAERDVPVLAVCAALQILGQFFDDGEGGRTKGVGLIDVETDRLDRRAVGETVVEPDPGSGLDLGTALLTGFENHGGRTVRGTDCTPLGTVRVGVGNGDGTDGVVTGRIVGTYLHGPVLARNPALADRLLEWALGALPPLEMPLVDQLHDERLAAARAERDRQPVSAGAPRRRGRAASPD
jgi:lipid II isoglutaminyl synthase (glutamine-hydrolysing)